MAGKTPKGSRGNWLHDVPTKHLPSTTRNVQSMSPRHAYGLSQGVPPEDVVTMLEVRRRFEIPSSICSARAREIALTAQRMISRTKSA